MNKTFPIYEKTHRSGNRSWMVSLGTINGKRKFRYFESREQAEHFRANCLETAAAKNPESFADLTELARASHRLAIEKAKAYGATVLDAVEFLIKYGKPPNGKVSIQEAMDLFAEVKREKNLSEKYITTALRCFFAPFRNAFKNRLISEITSADAEKYINQNRAWSFTSKNTHHRHLRTLYAFLIKRGYATLNPFASLEFATEKANVREKIISPVEVKALLQYALDRGYKAECASMVLVFFCGVRVDEISRLNWRLIRLDGANSFVDIQEAKNRHRRVNAIPHNALEWLSLCHAEGRVAPPNYTKRMQRLRKNANVNYPQNAARHCFASYHIASHRDAAQTAFLLGHPNAALLYNTYRTLVSAEEAEKYWNIVPDSVVRQRAELEQERRCLEEAKLRERDEAEKRWAEVDSNCGRAVRDASGRWVPLDPLIPDDLELDPVIPDDVDSAAISVYDEVLENV